MALSVFADATGITEMQWGVERRLRRMHALFWPDAFIVGEAVSERYAKCAPHLHSSAQIRSAHFAEQAGAIGAALAAAS